MKFTSSRYGKKKRIALEKNRGKKESLRRGEERVWTGAKVKHPYGKNVLGGDRKVGVGWDGWGKRNCIENPRLYRSRKFRISSWLMPYSGEGRKEKTEREGKVSWIGHSNSAALFQ